MSKAKFFPFLLTSALASTAGFSGTVDQETYDVRLVAAQISGDLVSIGETGSQVALTSCREESRREQWLTGVHIYDDVSLDCRQAVSALLHVPVISRVSVYTAVQTGTLKMVNPGVALKARRVDVYTATRDAALAPAAGVGFYFGFEETFVPKNKLVRFMGATDGNHDAVTVLRFAGLFTGAAFDSVMLKPYVRYDDGGTQFRNWENLTPRVGSPYVTGGFGGTGNYFLQAQIRESLRFDDVIREWSQIPIPNSPAPARLEKEVVATDIVTITHVDGKTEAEVALQPYSWGVELKWSPDSVQVEAGKEVWIRYSNRASAGHTPKLLYKTSESGAETEAGQLLGGNCFDFARCFRILIPEGAQGRIFYRIDDVVTFSFQIASAATAESLLYAPEKALELAKAAGLVPEFLAIDAVFTAADGHTTRLPLGQISSRRDQNLQLIYTAKMVDLNVELAPYQIVKVEIRTFLQSSQTLTLVDESPEL